MREIDLFRALRDRLPEILKEGRVEGWEIMAPLRHAKDSKADAEAFLKIGGQRLCLLFEGLTQPNLARLKEKAELVRLYAGRRKNSVPVIVAPYLNAEMREFCEKAGVAYVDLSGNAWLARGAVVIRKEVARNLYPHEAGERSPFADKASLVLRHLIGMKESAGVRQVASAVKLDPGYVSRVLRAARDLGYASSDSEGRYRLRNIEEMLADWSSYYSWRRNDCRWFFWLEREGRDVGGLLRRELKHWPEASYAVSLHGGNNQIEPFVSYDIWHLYGRDESVVKRLLSIRGVQEAPADAGNIVVMEPYYAQSAFYGARLVNGVNVVSDVQLYLDLRRFPVRGAEAAERIMERRLRPLWEKR